jgi:hypothetical protein
MSDLNIVEKSNASNYCQVMMTPKKDGSRRFCAEYRNMNDCTEPASWPKRTMHKLHLLKLRWPNMRLDVKIFIRECPCCQKMSQIKIPIQACIYTLHQHIDLWNVLI